MYRKIFCILWFVQMMFVQDCFGEKFRVYVSGEKCLLEIPRDMLGRVFLVVSRLDSVYDNRTYQPGSKQGKEFVVSFRQGDTGEIEVYMPDYQLRAEVSSVEMARLLARNRVEWPVMRCPVEREEEACVVIELTAMMMRENPFFDSVGKQVIDSRGGDDFFSCTVKRELPQVRRKWRQQGEAMTELPVMTTFFLLPECPWQMRQADCRVGFSSLSYDCFTDEQTGVRARRVVRRWALEPKDKAAYRAGHLTEPVCPIEFYLDPDIPARWKPYFVRAVEDWQRAFEVAGFRKAIVVREVPEGQARACLSARGMIHYQDSVLTEAVDVNVDPRSGEIIQSHVHWSPAILDSLKYDVLTRSGLWQGKFNPERLPESVVGEMIRVTLGQRVGMALGLLPNELSTKGYTVDQLRDCAWLREHGGGSFLMGNVFMNTVAQVGDRVAAGDLFPGVGAYEEWVIEWGYRYWQDEADGEKVRAGWLRERMAQPEYRWYGRSMSMPGKAVANLGYLGEEPIRGAVCALENVKRVFQREDLIRVKNDTTGWGGWVRRVGDRDGLLYDIVLPVLQQVGGIALLPDAGREDVFMPSAVRREVQREAVRFLNQHVFTTPEWLVHSRLVKRAGADPGKIILAWQCAALEYLFDSSLEQFARNNLMERSNAKYTLFEFMDDLYEGIWVDSVVGKEDVYRMVLRDRYLDIMKDRLKKNPRGDVSVALQVHFNKMKMLVEHVLSGEVVNREEWNNFKMKIEDVFK